MLTVGSLFSGIGGLDLGLERAGFTIRWQSEIDPYASRVLAKHWPDVPNLGDITKIDWENDALDHGDGIARSLHVDLVCGGFPCQPVSLAGRRRAQSDDRWLWPEMARAIRHLRPGHVLLENVPGLLVRGMGDVLGDLATLGYDTEWESLPAAAVGAPHIRDRVFFIGHRTAAAPGWPGGERGLVANTPGGGQRSDQDHQDGPEERYLQSDLVGSSTALANTDGSGRERARLRRAAPQRRADVADTEGVPVRAGLCEGDPAGVWVRRFGDLGGPGGGRWNPEPDVGRVVNGVPSRVDRLRCLGNAVVPQVAEYVGRQLAAHIDGSQADG